MLKTDGNIFTIILGVVIFGDGKKQIAIRTYEPDYKQGQNAHKMFKSEFSESDGVWPIYTTTVEIYDDELCIMADEDRIKLMKGSVMKEMITDEHLLLEALRDHFPKKKVDFGFNI